MIATRSSQFIGIGLLVFVNIVWVAASEITRYLFIDLDFKRPFFFTYAKSCMLVFFFIPYVCRCRKNPEESSSKKSGKSFYRRLKNEYDDDDESEKEEGSDDECFDKTLTEPDFELMDLESNTGGEHSTREGSQSSLVGENNQQQQQRRAKSRRVKFNKYREVRSIPEKLENAAKLARLPYRPNNGGDMMCLDCAGAQKSALFNYYVYFAPLWLIGSVSYQTALAYSSVSAVNLIAASSPLFVLILSALCGRYSPLDQFSWFKLIMVLLNFGGVCIVSKFSDSLIGSIISLFSAFSNALYLFALSRMSTREGNVDMPLMLGTVGIFSLLVCTPLMLMLHFTGLEPQLPFASFKQLGVLTINSFLGTIFADSLWLYATIKTGALTSTLSGSLAIPLFILFDTYWRHQPLNTWQLLSSIPIMISFIGASYYTAIQTPTIQHRPLKNEEGGGHDDDCSTTATKATSTDGLEINSLHPPHNSNNASSTTSLQSQVSM